MSDPTPAVHPAPKSPLRWGKILLFVSLAFNLLVVGLVAGVLLSGPRDRDRNPALRSLGFGPFVSALPRKDQEALRDAMRGEAGSFRENRARIRSQFEAILTALRADPYDPAEVERLVAAQQDRISERQTLGKKILLDRIEGMSPENRLAYADTLATALKRGRTKK
jgi:uncharacterized membrane protein